MARAGGRIETHALAELGQGTVLRAAVPEGDPEVVVGFGGFGRERDRTLQVRAGERQISLLSKEKPEQVVRLRVLVVAADGLA